MKALALAAALAATAPSTENAARANSVSQMLNRTHSIPLLMIISWALSNLKHLSVQKVKTRSEVLRETIASKANKVTTIFMVSSTKTP